MTTKRGMRSLTVAGLLAVLGLASITRAQEEIPTVERQPLPQEEVIPVDRLPKAVLRGAMAKFPGAKIQQATKQTEGDKTAYVLDMQQLRHAVDVTFRRDGTVVLVQTEITRKRLPRAVLKAAGHKYPGAILRQAVAVSQGPEVRRAADYYELYLLTAKKRPRLFKVDPKGKALEDPFRRIRGAPRPPVNRTLGFVTQ